MIGSQLICWITVIILVIYSDIRGSYASDTIYELTAVFLTPLNSYLNPIFNSSIFKLILGLINKVVKKIRKRGVKEDEPRVRRSEKAEVPNVVYSNSGAVKEPRVVIEQ